MSSFERVHSLESPEGGHEPEGSKSSKDWCNYCFAPTCSLRKKATCWLFLGVGALMLSNTYQDPTKICLQNLTVSDLSFLIFVLVILVAFCCESWLALRQPKCGINTRKFAVVSSSTGDEKSRSECGKSFYVPLRSNLKPQLRTSASSRDEADCHGKGTTIESVEPHDDCLEGNSTDDPSLSGFQATIGSSDPPLADVVIPVDMQIDLLALGWYAVMICVANFVVPCLEYTLGGSSRVQPEGRSSPESGYRTPVETKVPVMRNNSLGTGKEQMRNVTQL